MQLCNFFHLSVTSSLLDPKTFPNTPFLNTHYILPTTTQESSAG